MLLFFIIDDTEPGICSFYENVNCWNGTANVTTNNVIFNDRTVAGQGKGAITDQSFYSASCAFKKIFILL